MGSLKSAQHKTGPQAAAHASVQVGERLSAAHNHPNGALQHLKPIHASYRARPNVKTLKQDYSEHMKGTNLGGAAGAHGGG